MDPEASEKNPSAQTSEEQADLDNSEKNPLAQTSEELADLDKSEKKPSAAKAIQTDLEPSTTVGTQTDISLIWSDETSGWFHTFLIYHLNYYKLPADPDGKDTRLQSGSRADPDGKDTRLQSGSRAQPDVIKSNDPGDIEAGLDQDTENKHSECDTSVTEENRKGSGDAEDWTDLGPEANDKDEQETRRPTAEGKLNAIRKILTNTSWLRSVYYNKHRVGIFSRSSENDYQWLKTRLDSEYFQNVIEEVRSNYIRNNGFQQFMDDLSWCTFGILYHTKNRGRINVTNVTDSLYDEELRYMYEILGRNNVIVIIDDVSDDSEKRKEDILKNQTSIKEQARDLFLFTSSDHQK